MATQIATYDPFAPGFLADPYPQYRQLREENPVHLTRFGFWLLTRHRDVVEAYEHPGLSRDTRLWPGFAAWRQGSTDGPLERMMANWLVLVDPPRHTPLRAIHDGVFTHDLLRRSQPAIERTVVELLDRAMPVGGMDVIADLADRLPVYVICDLLGIPREDWPRFVPWSRAIALSTEPMLNAEILAAAAAALRGMYDYLGRLAERRRREPGADVISGLATGEHAGQRLRDDELLDSLVFLYQAGHPTTTHLIGLGLLSLLRSPGQLDLLRRDGTLLPNAVEELCRYDGPVQMNGRVATADLELCGVEVREGQLIRLCLGSANRDPERYPDPDTLSITRPAVQHLGFGRGIHACVGDHLGRVMVRAALAGLLERAPGLRLAHEELRFGPSASNRALTALPVCF
jgi:cytochrome P450